MFILDLTSYEFYRNAPAGDLSNSSSKNVKSNLFLNETSTRRKVGILFNFYMNKIHLNTYKVILLYKPITND
jgi:hypothetical protein